MSARDTEIDRIVNDERTFTPMSKGRVETRSSIIYLRQISRYFTGGFLNELVR